jgi:hypothetical protein
MFSNVVEETTNQIEQKIKEWENGNLHGSQALELAISHSRYV